jgi:hypothetical protein
MELTFKENGEIYLGMWQVKSASYQKDFDAILVAEGIETYRNNADVVYNLSLLASAKLHSLILKGKPFLKEELRIWEVLVQLREDKFIISKREVLFQLEETEIKLYDKKCIILRSDSTEFCIIDDDLNLFHVLHRLHKVIKLF